MSALYRSLPPSAQSSQYNPNALIPIDIPIDSGMALLVGSIRISGTLHAESAPNTPLVVADGVKYDSQAGIHGMVNSFVSTLRNADGTEENTVENLPYYNRYAKMLFEANQSYYSQALSNATTMELRCGIDDYTPLVLGGERDKTRAATGDNSFAFKPLIAVNRTNQNVDGSKVSIIKLQMTLESLKGAFFTEVGGSFPAAFKWWLEDVYVHYILVPGNPEAAKSPLQYQKIYCSKRDVRSTETNLTFSPPASVISCSCTFIQALLAETANKLETVLLPDVNRVEFTIGGTDSVIKFPLKYQEEIALNYIMSLNPALLESNAIYANLLDKGYGIGLNLLLPQNLQQNRFGLNVQCGDVFAGQWSMYAFFSCIEAF